MVSGSSSARRRSSILGWVGLSLLACVAVRAYAGLCGATASPSRGSAPLTVQFQGVASQCERNRGKEFWIIDGVPLTGVVSFTRVFEVPGERTWEFCSWLAGCEQCCDGGTIRVESSGCRLNCEATAAPRSEELPLVVDFRASATPEFCPPGNLTFAWDFGDGVSGEGSRVTHQYEDTGPYSWRLTARYGEATCTVTDRVEAKCVRIGALRFCADELRRAPGTARFTLRGNVRVNDLARFSGDVQLDVGREPPVLVSDGDLLVQSEGGWLRILESTRMGFEVMGTESRLDPMLGYPMFLFVLPNVLGLQSLVFGTERVDARSVAVVGLSGIAELARIDTTHRFVAGRCPELVETRVLTGAVSPSISFAEVELEYDCNTKRLDTRFVCRFPFSGGPSFVGSFGFDPCGLNRFHVTLGQVLGEGITITPPVVPVRLKAGRDLVVRGDHVCDREPLFIYVGTRATLCIETGVECISIPGEFFRVADLGLGYQHPLNFDIAGGTAQVLGFPVAGLRGRIQGNQPPYGMLLRGYATVAQFVEGSADLGVSFSRALAYGSIRGQLQIPSFSCDPVNYLCKTVRSLLTKLAGPLPARFADTTLVVTGRASEQSWSATAHASMHLGNWPLVVLVQLADEGATLQVGSNYAQMYALDFSGPSTRSTVTRDAIELSESARDAMFVFAGVSRAPLIRLISPAGVELTTETVGSWISGAFGVEDQAERLSAFFLPHASAGTWRWRVEAGELVAVRLFGARPRPNGVFEEVRREGDVVLVRARIEPASAVTSATLEYRGDFAGGVFGVLAADADDRSGLLVARWPLRDLGTDTYRLRLVVRDEAYGPAVVDWPEPIVVDQGLLDPPRNLRALSENGGVRLWWDPSSSHTAVGYVVAFTDVPEEPGYPFVRSVPWGNELRIGGLEVGRKYRFVVVARNAEGQVSLPSNAVEVSVDAGNCSGDCNGDGEVTIEEIILGVNIALELAPLAACGSFDRDGDAAVTVDEIIVAVSQALYGCGLPGRPSPSATPVPSAGTVTASFTATRSSTPKPTSTIIPFTLTPVGTLSPTAPRTATATGTPRTTTSPTAGASATRLSSPSPSPTVSRIKVCSNLPTPRTIPDDDPFGIGDQLSVPLGVATYPLRVEVEISHSWVGDLSLWLVHLETGTQVQLVDRPGAPPLGCTGDDMDCTFDDRASMPAQDACDEEAPAIRGHLRPLEPLSAFAGEDLGGTWLLGVADNAAGDVGELRRWCLEFGD